MARSLRIALVVMLALGAGLSALVVWVHWHLHIAPFRGEGFSTERWQQVWACEGLSNPDCALHRAACSRGSMVADLLSRHLLLGITLHSARALLGPPQWQSAIWARDGVLPDCDHYHLGNCTGFGVDTDVLYVCAGPGGEVVAVGHYQS